MKLKAIFSITVIFLLLSIVPAQNINLVLQPDATAGKDALIIDGSAGNTNYGTNDLFNAWRYSAGSWYIRRSLLQFDLSSIPINAVVVSATLTLYKHTTNHYGVDNTSVLRKLTQSWVETTVTYNNQPPFSMVDSVIVPNTTSVTQASVSVDVKNHVQYWINNPTLNNGWVFKLYKNFESITTYAEQSWASSDFATSASRPKLDLTYYIPISYKTLKKKVDGGYYELSSSNLYFKYDEEYKDTDGNLNYNLYNDQHTKITGLPTLPVVYGDNRYTLNLASIATGYYTLEVINEKNEKWYLRLKK
jgi:hypothetical protein